MRGLRSLTISRRRLVLALFACAMLLRVLVPEGWMPVTGAGGWRLTVCDGMGPAAAMAAMPGMVHRHAPPAHDQGDHPCTFAGLGLAAALPDFVPVLVASVVSDLPAMLITKLVSIGRGLAAPPPPATGPPARS